MWGILRLYKKAVKLYEWHITSWVVCNPAFSLWVIGNPAPLQENTSHTQSFQSHGVVGNPAPLQENSHPPSFQPVWVVANPASLQKKNPVTLQLSFSLTELWEKSAFLPEKSPPKLSLVSVCVRYGESCIFTPKHHQSFVIYTISLTVMESCSQRLFTKTPLFFFSHRSTVFTLNSLKLV